MLNHISKVVALAAMAFAAAATAGAQTISATIPFTAPTNGITVDPVRNKVYVVASDPTETIFNLAVIDGKSNTVTSNIPLTSGAEFTTVDYVLNKVYVTGCNYLESPAPCIVTVIDGNSGAVVTTIPISSQPGGGLTGVVVNPLTGLVYVANANENVIEIIDGHKNKVVGSISLNGNAPNAIALNFFLNLLYVPYGSDQTAVVNATTKKIVTTTTFGTYTTWAAANVVTGKVFVADQEFVGSSSLTGVLNAVGTLEGSVPVADFPTGVDVDPINNLAFVASPLAQTVAVIDGSSNTLKTTVSGVEAQYVAVNPVTHLVYTSGLSGVTVLTEK